MDARRLGAKLLGREVEVCGLGEVLASLRELLRDPNEGHFGIPELDTLLPSPAPAQQAQNVEQQQRSDDLWDPNSTTGTNTAQAQQQHENGQKKKEAKKHGGPILELISPPPTHHASGAGKTSLVYLIITLAILPSRLSSFPLGGKNAAVILFDPLTHFSIPRLAQVMTFHISTRLKAHPETPAPTSNEVKSCVKRALTHIHIFRPQSWDSLLHTLKSLPAYLFTPHNHKSTHRPIHTLILEDVSSFQYQIRSETTSTSTSTTTSQNNITTASARLTTHLTRLSALLSCSVITTSHSSSPTGYRSVVPTTWPTSVVVVKLGLRRAQVLKFAPGVSAEEAEGERGKRWDVVVKGRVECWKVGGREEGFVVRVGRGVVVEENDAV